MTPDQIQPTGVAPPPPPPPEIQIPGVQRLPDPDEAAPAAPPTREELEIDEFWKGPSDLKNMMTAENYQSLFQFLNKPPNRHFEWICELDLKDGLFSDYQTYDEKIFRHDQRIHKTRFVGVGTYRIEGDRLMVKNHWPVWIPEALHREREKMKELRDIAQKKAMSMMPKEAQSPNADILQMHKDIIAGREIIQARQGPAVATI